LTASFGVAQRLADTASPEQLVDLADQALAAAKRAGRDRAIAYRQLIQPVPLEEHAGELTALLQVIPARDVMSSIVAPLNQDQTAATAADYFLRLRISSAPVTDAQGQLVGLLSEKDLMTIMLGQRWWALPIHQVMKRNVVCYEEDTPSLAIFEFLSRVAVGSVVIVQGGRPTGVLTRGCLLRFFMNVLATRLNGGVCPEVDQAARELVARMARSRPRDRIAQTVHALAVEVDDLQRSLAGQNGELLPAVVGSASRMQELLLDLLAASRSVHAADSQGPFRVQSENADYRRRSAASSAPGAARPVPAGDCVLHDAAG
jgi:two-component system cell cycle response regulator